MKLRLQEIRENYSKRYSQESIARMMGLTLNAYRNLEKNSKVSITYYQLEWLCNFFDVTPNDLFDMTTLNVAEKQPEQRELVEAA
jgi:transcriptional regulator with XRE-family HTH domain